MSHNLSNPVYRYGILAAVVVGGATLAVTLGPGQANATPEEPYALAEAAQSTAVNMELVYFYAGLSVVGAAVGIGLGEYRHLHDPR